MLVHEQGHRSKKLRNAAAVRTIEASKNPTLMSSMA